MWWGDKDSKTYRWVIETNKEGGGGDGKREVEMGDRKGERGGGREKETQKQSGGRKWV